MRKKYSAAMAGALIVCLFCAFPLEAGAKNEGKGHGNMPQDQSRNGMDRSGHGKGGFVGADGNVGIGVPEARSLARQCGLGGQKALPPGIAKNLARGKPLPPGIAKRMVPGDMLGKLPAYPGYEWIMAGRDLLLIEAGTMVIEEILRDVFL